MQVGNVGLARTADVDGDVDGRTVHVSRLVLATGAPAAVPPIEGLAESSYLDNRCCSR